MLQDGVSVSTLVSIRDLNKRFPIRSGALGRRSGWLQALREVSLEIRRGEILGLVGESGCGKTTLARCLLRLERADGGIIELEGRDLTTLTRGDLRDMRRSVQLVFQDPWSSLNPRMRIRDIVAEPLRVHGLASGAELVRRTDELLTLVGLEATHGGRYPHEFSGGQRQRIGIARALATEPQLLVADEPVSALDVSVQAQIINLLHDLRDQLGLTILFISHDLAVVRQICDRVAVMYLGQIVESAQAGDLFGNPLHPYSGALLAAVPRPDPRCGEERVKGRILEGDPVGGVKAFSGCAFQPRCFKAEPECMRNYQPLLNLGNDRSVRCHRHE
ncbi:MAG: ABC transporter ATP-binding protein [bacterium]|nr:ABC transporter ATP-binding protein [bacterium]